MGSKKKRGGTITGQEQQTKSVVQDAGVSKKQSESEEEKSKSNSSHSSVVKNSATSVIDEIFGNKKRKVVVAKPDDSAVGVGATQVKKKKVKGIDTAVHEQRSSDKPASGVKSRKRTLDGYKVYSQDEIGWNKSNAGGTASCPFDCDCCF